MASLWVVLFHAAEGKHIPALLAALPGSVAVAAFGAGHLGVPIFFALSGFVIAYSLRDAEPSWAMFGRFVVRRSLRLDPPYWAAIALALAMAWLSARVIHKPWHAPAAPTILAHLFYLQGLLQAPAINPAFWTLTYEVQFYLFFVATQVVTAKLAPRHGATAAWIIFYALAIGSALGLFGSLWPGVFFGLWANFLVGALAYIAPGRPWATLGLAVLVAAMAARAGITGEGFAAAAAACAVLFYWSLRRGFATTALSWPWLQFLGTISYSMYLLHNPITGATGFVSRRLGLAGSAGRESGELLVILAAVIGGSTLFWYLVERPAHRLSQRSVRVAS